MAKAVTFSLLLTLKACKLQDAIVKNNIEDLLIYS
jgi:hypothetical protein